MRPMKAKRRPVAERDRDSLRLSTGHGKPWDQSLGRSIRLFFAVKVDAPPIAAVRVDEAQARERVDCDSPSFGTLQMIVPAVRIVAEQVP